MIRLAGLWWCRHPDGFSDPWEYQSLWSESYYAPIKNFLTRYGRLVTGGGIGGLLSNISDIVWALTDRFYREHEFTVKRTSLTSPKSLNMYSFRQFSRWRTALRFGAHADMLLGAVLSALCVDILSGLADADSINALALTIAVDNLSVSIAVAAFIVVIG